MWERFLRALPAFKYFNYRIYFPSQLFSVVGTWIQTVAQGYLVYQLTHSPFWVGVVTALGFLPVLFLGLFGGVIVDRFNKKYLILFNQTAAGVIALTLGLVTVTGHVNLTWVSLLAFLMGVNDSLYHPLRLSLIYDLVAKEDLHSAIALNSSIYNGGRIIGPALAGILIASLGVGIAFIINAISFLGPILAFLIIKLPQHIKREHPPTLYSIKNGFVYVWQHRVIKLMISYISVIAIFGWSYITIMPVISDRVFHQGPSGLGLLYSSSGLGAVLGAFLFSGIAKKFQFQNIVTFGGGLFVLSILSFSLTSYFPLGLFFLFFSGLGLSLQGTTMQTTLQHNVESHIRGRVMSIYTLSFLGLAPLGSFQVGFISENLGTQLAIRLGAIIIFLSGLILIPRLRKVK